VQILLQLLVHVATAVAISLKPSKLSNSVCASYISICNFLLHADVAVPLAIHVDLQIVIQLVSVVLHVQALPHLIHICFEDVEVLDEARAVPIYPVQFCQHHV